jgi:hypothetical protein
MVEITGGKVLFLDTAISDVNGSLRLELWQNLAGAYPFTLLFDGRREWLLPLAHARGLSATARRLDGYIARAVAKGEAPKPGVALRESVEFPAEIIPFEIGAAIEPAHLFVAWDGVRIVPGPTKRDELLMAFERMGQVATEINESVRRVIQMRIDPMTYVSPFR